MAAIGRQNAIATQKSSVTTDGRGRRDTPSLVVAIAVLPVFLSLLLRLIGELRSPVLRQWSGATALVVTASRCSWASPGCFLGCTQNTPLGKRQRKLRSQKTEMQQCAVSYAARFPVP